ncbi:MAG: hypothetical protein ACRELE_04430 [Gemmatimonadales bacterium]
MRRLPTLCGAVLLLASCSQKATSPTQRGAPLTQRQHDSVIGASGLPGAAGVRGALRVSDSMATRRARIDSASSAP